MRKITFFNFRSVRSNFLLKMQTCNNCAELPLLYSRFYQVGLTTSFPRLFGARIEFTPGRFGDPIFHETLFQRSPMYSGRTPRHNMRDSQNNAHATLLAAEVVEIHGRPLTTSFTKERVMVLPVLFYLPGALFATASGA